MDDLLSKAIVKVREKVSTSTPTVVSVPSEPYAQIFTMLDVWGDEVGDEDNQKKAKFIYEALGENPKDKLLSLYSTMPVVGMERKIDKVYKYCRLKDQAHKAMQRFEQLEKEMYALSNHR